MKNIIITLIILFSFQIYAQEKVTLPEGTLVKAVLLKDINGRDLNPGDKLEFMLNNTIVVDNKYIADTGAKIIGTVTDAKGSRMLGKKGKLEFTIDYLYLTNGEVVKLTSQNKKNLQGSGVGVVASAVLLTPFTLLLHGKNAKYKSGTEFSTYVAESIIVTSIALK